MQREKRTWILVMAMLLALTCALVWWLAHRDARAKPSGNAYFVTSGIREGRRLI